MENNSIQKTSAGQGLGIAGLVLGIISFPLAFIPCINVFAALVAIVGLILSAIGFSQARKLNGATGLNLAGLILSSLAVLVILLWVLVFARIFSREGDFRREFDRAFRHNIRKETFENIDKISRDLDRDLERQLQELEADTTMPLNALSTEEFDALLKNYENLINEYIKLVEKSKRNDISAVPSFAHITAKAASISARLALAAPEMSEEQMNKFDELQKRYEDALKKASEK